MNIESYLNRIDYRGALDISVETLFALHRSHLLAVPFENLDIHLGREIVLDEASLVSKIVDRRRGGFCYELNSAFASLLRELGFKVDILSAGVACEEGGFDPPFDHMALAVHLEQLWLADVGFGDSFRDPLLLLSREIQTQNDEAYNLVDDEDEHLILRRREGLSWTNRYRFTLKPYRLDDFSEMCRFHQTSPASPFTRKKTCTLATPEGRITVTGMRLITTAHGNKRERELAGVDEYLSVMRECFGVELDRSEVETRLMRG